jgi:predicted transcriptional regulator
MRLLNLSDKRKVRVLSGELESAIMKILWAKGPLKGRDLHVEIRREKGIAYTTALTVLDRLSKKGFVKKDRDSGMITFSPRISREAYQNTVAEDLVQRAFDVSPDLAVSAFAEAFSRMPKEDLDKLEKLLEERKNGADQD